MENSGRSACTSVSETRHHSYRFLLSKPANERKRNMAKLILTEVSVAIIPVRENTRRRDLKSKRCR